MCSRLAINSATPSRVLTAFDFIALVYGALAVGVVVRLVRNGRRTFDDELTREDRTLVGMAAFYLVVPFAVALHELGHAAVTWALGGHLSDWHFGVYWGYVVPAREPPFLPWESACTAAAGNLVSLAIGAGAAASVVRWPRNAAWNALRLELARTLLGLTLALYPLLSLATGEYDFAILRDGLNQTVPLLGDVVIAAYLLVSFSVALLWTRGGWRDWYLRVTGPYYDPERKARARWAASPEDAATQKELARVLLVADRVSDALPLLEKADAAAPEDPQLAYFLGIAWMKLGNPRVAAEHLCRAGALLERGVPTAEPAELLFDVTLVLAASRLASGDATGALETAEAARELRPRDGRTTLLIVDALLASGRRDEARRSLEAALEGAQGAYAAELRRRLNA